MNPENKTATFKVKICQIAVSYISNAPSHSMNDNNGFLKWKTWILFNMNKKNDWNKSSILFAAPIWRNISVQFWNSLMHPLKNQCLYLNSLSYIYLYAFAFAHTFFLHTVQKNFNIYRLQANNDNLFFIHLCDLVLI